MVYVPFAQICPYVDVFIQYSNPITYFLCYLDHISTMAPKASAKSASQSVSGLSPVKKPKGSPPRKKKHAITPKKKVKQIGSGTTLTVTRFSHPLTLEMYIYTSKLGDDGYLNGLQVALAGSRPDGTIVPPSQFLVDGNFHSVPYRRLPNTNNEHAINNNSFWRYVILRYPPNQESTSETRQEGLALLSAFFKDPTHSKFPPANINLVDETDEQNLPSLDHYLFDDTIQEIMTEDLDETILNGNFYTDYSAFARKCWAYPFLSVFARSLGFPDE